MTLRTPAGLIGVRPDDTEDPIGKTSSDHWPDASFPMASMRQALYSLVLGLANALRDIRSFVGKPRLA